MSTESPSSRWGVALPAFESVFLVVLGVAATKLPSLWAFGIITIAALSIVFTRVVASGATRDQRAREWLAEYSSDRVSLFSTLQEVATHVDSKTWTTYALASGVQWWMDEDLVGDYLHGEEIKRQEQEDARRDERASSSFFKEPRRRAFVRRIQNLLLKARLRFYRLERAVNPPLHLIDAAFHLGSEQTARVLLLAAVREEFVSEVVEHRKYGDIRRKYQFCEGIMTIRELQGLNERYWTEEEPEPMRSADLSCSQAVQ